MENTLTSVDPLSPTSNLTNSKEYSDLIDYATSYKIRSSPKTVVKVSDLLEQFVLLTKRTDQVNLLTDADFEISEIQGSNLSLINLLVHVNSNLSSTAVEVTVNEGILCYTIIKPNHISEQCLPLLEKSSLWNILKILLPISDIKECKSSIVISVPAIKTTQARTDTLNIWWAYLLQGVSNIAANDIIAAMLHSLKNDILGFSISSLQAQSQQSNRDRYQLATDASDHIERALTNLRTVRSLSNNTVKPEISPVKIGGFVRGLISSLWSWVPESVTLDFASIDSNIEVFTNKESLHSILVNLIINSVESLDGSGVISVKYFIDPEHEGIEFLITDSGAGFNKEQLYLLNIGSPVKSSKKNGQGIGLLTIILLTKELNGTLDFFNSNDDGGANIKVWIPSSPPVDEGCDY